MAEDGADGSTGSDGGGASASTDANAAADSGDHRSGGSDSPGPLGTLPRKIGAAILVLVALVVVAYLLGIIGPPSAGIADRGDWGTVTEERTEVITTLWVDNPNPFGVSIGSGVSAEYALAMNDVTVARGSKTGIDVPAGNDTTELRTSILNDRLPAWWVGFVRADETVELGVDARLRAKAGLTASYRVQRNRTLLEDSTPIIDALSGAVNGTAGTYTKTVSTSEVSDESVLDGVGDQASVTAGYEVERGWATWESVNRSYTTVEFHVRVHNPGDVPMPALPDGIGVTIDMNDVELFEGESGALSSDSLGEDAVIEPGETREITFEVTMDNQRIDEWFTSHVEREERTEMAVGFQLVFRDPATGTEFRLPADGPETYRCSFRTAILVDDRTTSTDCGNTVAPGDGSESESASDGTETPAGPGTPTEPGTPTLTAPTPGTPTLTGADTPTLTDLDTPTPTVTDVATPTLTVTDVDTPTVTLTATDTQTPTETPQPPTARISANTTSGSAPLTVAFDASDSTDPNGDISRYTWTFGDGSGTAEGEQVTHTFETAGQYLVTLTVVDETGRQDTDTVTVEVTVG